MDMIAKPSLKPLTVEQYRSLQSKKKPSKYRNQKVESDGLLFDSRKEARRHWDLQALLRAGLIRDLRTQPWFVLAPSVRLKGESRAKPALRYRADFSYVIVENGERIVEDVKSPATREKEAYRIKRHLMKSVHGLDITEI